MRREDREKGKEPERMNETTKGFGHKHINHWHVQETRWEGRVYRRYEWEMNQSESFIVYMVIYWKKNNVLKIMTNCL